MSASGLLGNRLDEFYKLDGVGIYLTTSGAAAGLQKVLWQPPGASAWLVGANFPYDKSQTDEFLGFEPAKYVSTSTAVYLAQEAFMRAVRSGRKRPIGLGMTCSVASGRVHRGDHRIIGVVMSDEGTWIENYNLQKDVGWSARDVDGDLADEVGLSLIMTALGMCHGPRKMSDEEAQSYLFDHPVFKPCGRRDKVVQGGMCLPGSFDPMHFGHREMAKEAERYSDCRVFYNITATSPHKGNLTTAQLLRRASQFRLEDRELLLTRNDPLYIDKARNMPNMSFVMGADTAVRFLDPKWNQEQTVEQMLEEFQELGTYFFVNDRKNKEGVLQTLEDAHVPDRFRSLFFRVPGHWDISSSQIREGVVK